MFLIICYTSFFFLILIHSFNNDSIWHLLCAGQRANMKISVDPESFRMAEEKNIKLYITQFS